MFGGEKEELIFDGTAFAIKPKPDAGVGKADTTAKIGYGATSKGSYDSNYGGYHTFGTIG